MTQIKNECTAKRILPARPEGKSGIGRPKMKWVDGVNQDSARIGERIAGDTLERRMSGRSF